MGIPVLNLKEEEQWRTELQPLVVIVEVSEEDSVIEVEEVTVVEEVEELRIATPQPRAPLELWVTLPRPHTPPSQLLTLTSPLTCGRRPSSRSLPTRSSLTFCQRTIAPWV